MLTLVTPPHFISTKNKEKGFEPVCQGGGQARASHSASEGAAEKFRGGDSVTRSRESIREVVAGRAAVGSDGG